VEDKAELDENGISATVVVLVDDYHSFISVNRVMHHDTLLH